MAAFHIEIEEVIIKEEPKEEWINTDVSSVNDDEEAMDIQVKTEIIKQEIELPGHELKTDNKLFQCYKTEYRPQISKHPNREETVWFKCEKCDYKAKQRVHVKQHEISKHLNDDEINWFECDHCDHKTKRKYSLKCHIAAVHVPTECFKCEKCNYQSKKESNLNQHMIKKHLPKDETK